MVFRYCHDWVSNQLVLRRTAVAASWGALIRALSVVADVIGTLTEQHRGGGVRPEVGLLPARVEIDRRSRDVGTRSGLR